MDNTAPFRIYKSDSDFCVKAEVELLPEYAELFEKYDYEPNEYC